MADDSEKEKVTAENDEKEEDTTLAVGSKPNSKPGSAKSGKSGGSKPGTPSKSARARSPKSPKSPKSGRSDKSAKKSAKKKPASAKTEGDDDASQETVDKDWVAKLANFNFPDELPEGAKSLFLSSKTQELFDLGDSNTTEHKLVKLRSKSSILADILKRAAVSDFSPIKKKIQEYPEENIVIIADLDYKFSENFIILLSVEARDALLIAPEVS